jgi:catechol 2,3-dioxygenase-like lactoylglutathione lyase family enzyme
MEKIFDKLLGDFERGKINRRQLIKSLAFGGVTGSGIAAAESKPYQAVGINHISIQAPDYAAARDFYTGILGVEVLQDDGKGCSIQVGETTILIRKPSVRRKAVAGKVDHGSEKPGVDHISYTVGHWEADEKVEQAVRAELERHGLPTGQDQRPGRTRTFHVSDPVGLGLQLGGKKQLSEQ